MNNSNRIPGPKCVSRDFSRNYQLGIDYSIQLTPGPLGHNDQADPHYHLLDKQPLSTFPDRIDWNPDPHFLLLAARVNPDFGQAANNALDTAVALGHASARN
jgi:hypothetical protein